MNNDVNRHIVYGAITRPAMYLGVTIEYLAWISIVVLCSFMLFNSALLLFLYVPLHLVGWVFLRIDASFFNVILKRLSCPVVANKSFWGCQSYAPR